MYSEFDDDEFDELELEFLIEEPDDIHMIMMPEFKFDVEEYVNKLYKKVKKCRNKADLLVVLNESVDYISQVTLLQYNIREVQNKAKELELNVEIMREQGLAD